MRGVYIFFVRKVAIGIYVIIRDTRIATPIPPRISDGRCTPIVIRQISIIRANAKKHHHAMISDFLLYLYAKIRVVSATVIPTVA